MIHDHRDIVVALTLAALAHLNLADWVQVIVGVCAVGNLLISFLRWRFPSGH